MRAGPPRLVASHPTSDGLLSAGVFPSLVGIRTRVQLRVVFTSKQSDLLNEADVALRSGTLSLKEGLIARLDAALRDARSRVARLSHRAWRSEASPVISPATPASSSRPTALHLKPSGRCVGARRACGGRADVEQLGIPS